MAKRTANRAATVTAIGVDREWCRIHAEALKPRRVKVELFEARTVARKRVVLLPAVDVYGRECFVRATEEYQVVEAGRSLGYCYSTTTDLPVEAPKARCAAPAKVNRAA